MIMMMMMVVVVVVVVVVVKGAVTLDIPILTLPHAVSPYHLI